MFSLKPTHHCSLGHRTHKPHIIVGMLLLGSVLLTIMQGSPTQVRAHASARPLQESVEHLATPQLIDQAFKDGHITADQRLLYLAYALFDSAALPTAYHSTVGWYGTRYVAELQHALTTSSTASVTRAATLDSIRQIKAAQAGTVCDVNDGPKNKASAHFYLNYNSIGGSLNADSYLAALERAYTTEVSSYGWAQPPVSQNNPWNKFPVQASPLGDSLYGYVTSDGGDYTGGIGDNPSTSAKETAARASCMVINSDFTSLDPDISTQDALNVTTAHEFYHAIQFATGDPNPEEDLMWYESTAAYVENEVYPESNDNIQYLWPQFTSCLASYASGSNNEEYSNWLFFRYAAEHNGGTNNAGGGEDIVQALWTNIAAKQSALTAYNNALQTKGTTLAATFHNYAIASRFMKSATSAEPYTYQRGAVYVQQKGANANNAAITAIGDQYQGTLADNYALNWIGLPTGTPYALSFQNTSQAGEFRVSIVADLGAYVQVTSFSALAKAGETLVIGAYEPPKDAQSIVAVVTNQALTAVTANTCAQSSYTLSIGLPSASATNKVYLPILQR